MSKPTPEAMITAMSVFDCPRVRVVRDSQVGCLSLYLGRLVINVYGHDPYDDTPVVVEQTEREARMEANQIALEAAGIR